MMTICDSVHIPFDVVDLSEIDGVSQQQRVKETIQKESETPFDLMNDVLVKTILMILNDKEYLLFFNMHHIISDGWSMGIFSKELNHFYTETVMGEPSNLPHLPIQYADFAFWQRQWFQNGQLDQQLSYWEKHLKNVPPLLTLPTDFPRPVVQTFSRKKTIISH